MARVTRDGTKLKLNGADYTIIGADVYDILDSSIAEAKTRLTELKNRGVKSIRTWLFSKSGRLDTSGGVTFFDRLDALLANADELGMTVIGALSNWNTDWGGPDTWNRDQTTWFDSISSNWWMQVVSVLNHVNAGSHADVILAWEIMNEPRPDNMPTRMAWVGNVAQQIKQLDPNHLLSAGQEGFVHDPAVFPYPDAQSGASPDLDIIPATVQSGNQAIGMSSSPYVDLVSVHFYSKYLTSNFRANAQRTLAAITAMKAKADSLGKPLFLGEIGYDPRDYDQIYYNSDGSYHVPSDASFTDAKQFMHDTAVALHAVGAAGGFLWAWGRPPQQSFTLVAGDAYSEAVVADWVTTLIAPPSTGGSSGGSSGATIKVRVATAADDAYHAFKPASGHVFSQSANDVAVGLFSPAETDLGALMRFTGVALPRNAKIAAATLTLVSSGDDSAGTVRSRLSAVAADNAKMPADYRTFHNARFGSAVVPWDGIPAWTNGQAYTSPDLSALIQQIVNRSGWRSGNAIVLRWDDLAHRSSQVAGAVRRGRSYNNDPANAPLLTVSYT